MMLNHVTLPAHDYDASLAFYTALGLTQIVAAPPRYARFEMDGGATLSFEVIEGGRAGTAETYLHCEDVDAAYAAARSRGVVFDFAPRDETYLWRRGGVTDPAGNLIILYHAGTNQRFPPWRLDGLMA
ncbi:VOC family protein [Glacieibacterium frigidum]|uniref:VOC family protein n=1 Tax=Glacieibacterium frigidum TaxID=2593303 RepID=A0A552UA68_9SPHN|nr:VOC family protein [Glacieibacterium frigidum]TRW15115.1 VOC family protein [Glacieibacterium frigidum]